MTFPRRAPQPPQPIDPDSPAWVIRFYQWLIDRIEHLDECLDDFKTADADFKATVMSMIAAREDEDDALSKKIVEHRSFHDQMDAVSAKERLVWRQMAAAVAVTLGICATLIAGAMQAGMITFGGG